MLRSKLLAPVAATLLVVACAPSPTATQPGAFQVCGDKSARRVEDQLCRGAAEDNPYLWYYFDVAGPIPPVGAPLTGGSLIATNGVSYVTSSGAVGSLERKPSQPGQDSSPSTPPETVVTRGPDGAFMVNGEVNGHPVTFVVDTGASEVVLSPDDAATLGLSPANLKYDRLYQTANGVGRGASFQATEIRVGSIRIPDVSASINQAPMRYSLLGRTFLDRLNSFRVERGRLFLR